jgi:hypothetical protein
MGGGRLAITLRLITAHIVLRGFLVLAAVLETTSTGSRCSCSIC